MRAFVQTPSASAAAAAKSAVPASHQAENRLALMHASVGIFISCLVAVLFEGWRWLVGSPTDAAYVVNFLSGLIVSVLAWGLAWKGHPKLAMTLLSALLIVLVFHTTVMMNLGLRAPMMVLMCLLILSVNFTVGRQAGFNVLLLSCGIAIALFALEEVHWIEGMTIARYPPPVNTFIMLLCLYICVHAFSNAFRERSDNALQTLEDKNTELQRALQEKDLALEEKARAQAAKDRFLATMSHEIRTPMAGIRTAIALLQNPRITEQARGRYVDALDTTTESLLRLLNDLLDTAQLEAGALNVVTRPFSLHELVADTVALFELSAAEKSIQLGFEVDSDEHALVAGDPARLRQMISNLLGNAVKFTETGRIDVTVKQDTPQTEPDLWTFRITDTGPGISETNLQKLFKPFSQLENRGQVDLGGSGLGLSIVRKLAEAMGGESGVESRVGVGSVFWFKARLQAHEQATLPESAQIAA